MIKKLIWLQCALTISTTAHLALAQATGERSLGRRGQVAVSVERLFGVSHTSQSQGNASFTSVSVVGSSGYSLGFTPYSIPRLAIDGFLTDGLSLGVGANFANLSSSSESSTITVIGFSPRMGYAIEVSSGFTFWPRTGISYISIDTGTTAYQLAATLEAQCVITGPHLGFMLAPIADIGLAATRNNKFTQLGVETGLIGWF